MASDPNKFAEFDKLVMEAKTHQIDEVIIVAPEALGDDYEELVAKLNKIADAEVALRIVPRGERK